MELTSQSGFQPYWGLFATIVTILIVWQATLYRRLRGIPGPFLARISNVPRFLWVLSYRAHDKHIELHQKYGPIVRFGPNMVSVSAPSEINKIFRYSKPWKKSDFYKALLMKPDGKPIPGIFATQDEGIHNQLKRPIAGIYSMTTLLSFEPFVDTTMRVLCNELQSRFASTGKPCDLGLWLQMFAFDVIGDLTFSKRLGFLESGTDVNGVMKDLWDMFRQTSLVTQMPWTDNLWTNNPIRRYFRGRTISPGASFAMACVQERREEIKTGKMNVNLETRDFMSRFLEIEAQDEKLPPYALAAWASSNLTAGSDTTGILLRSVFHNLLTNPVSLSRLLDELNTAADSLGPMANWKSARDLPYLDAVIKEAGRLHPSFGLPFERVVPAGGATICGKFLPAGTVVGMSAWAVHHDKDMFGEDCDKWRPERWLDVDGEKRRSMENALLTFGAGHRSCLGKNIAYLEVYKVIPTLLRHFKFELLDEEEGGGWRVKNRWFVMAEGLIVRVTRV